MNIKTDPAPSRRKEDSESSLKKWIKSDSFFYAIFPLILIVFGLFIVKVIFEDQIDNLFLDNENKKNSVSKNVSNNSNRSELISSISSQSIPNKKVTLKSEAQKINELTNLLMAEQEKSKQLNQKIISQQSEISNILEESIANASVVDRDYIDAMNDSVPTKETPKLKKKNIAEIDYFNRIDIKKSTNNESSSLQSEIDRLLESNSTSTDEVYIVNLNKESDVRRNEVRSIILKSGDTIWKIAKRAYGDGQQYHKIMKANPHITENSARSLSTGTIILVPI